MCSQGQRELFEESIAAFVPKVADLNRQVLHSFADYFGGRSLAIDVKLAFFRFTIEYSADDKVFLARFSLELNLYPAFFHRIVLAVAREFVRSTKYLPKFYPDSVRNQYSAP